ncbi:MAG: histidine kinase N-terminal 7TM domain-containing protein, partial [Candidatus Dojkabacteria bacterium]|nr:histidine kinase N-terminal 7TM domain-containing protein [Candidatus Dojkabacteria bacterium]
MTLATILTAISAIALVILIVATLFSKQRTSQTRSLLLLLITILAWIVTMYLSNIQISPEIDLYVNRLIFSLVPLFVFFFFRLVATFKQENDQKDRSLSFSHISSLLLLLMAGLGVTKWVVTDITYDTETTRYDIITGPLYYFFLIITVSVVATLIFNLFRRQRFLTGLARSRIRLLAFSTLILTVLLIISNVFAPRFTGSSAGTLFAPLWIIIWLSMISYSIFKYRLFDINYVLGRILYFVLTGLILFGEFYLALYIGESVWGGSTNPRAIVFGLVFAGAVAVTNYYFNQNISQKLSEYLSFFTYNPDTSLRSFSKIISDLLDLEKISNQALKILETTLKPSALGLILVSKTTQEFSVYSFKAEGETTRIQKQEYLSEIIAGIRDQNNASVLAREELISLSQKSQSVMRIIEFMVSNSLFIIYPIFQQRKLIGLLLLGEKQNKISYTTLDISFIENFSSILAVAISRALLHKEVQTFSITLQKKVDTATRQLKERNKELQDLYDNLEELYQKEKDLMDIAGHEFRTPASILKNNLYLLKKRIQELL